MSQAGEPQPEGQAGDDATGEPPSESQAIPTAPGTTYNPWDRYPLKWDLPREDQF